MAERAGCCPLRLGVSILLIALLEELYKES
jgi:hypothetical protein